MTADFEIQKNDRIKKVRISKRTFLSVKNEYPIANIKKGTIFHTVYRFHPLSRTKDIEHILVSSMEVQLNDE